MNSRDRLVVRTLRCGRNNPGSNPGYGTFFFPPSHNFNGAGFFFFFLICFCQFDVFPIPFNVYDVGK